MAVDERVGSVALVPSAHEPVDHQRSFPQAVLAGARDFLQAVVLRRVHGQAVHPDAPAEHRPPAVRPAVQGQGLQAEQHELADVSGEACCHPADRRDRLHPAHLVDAEVLALGVAVRVSRLRGLRSEDVVEVPPGEQQPPVVDGIQLAVLSVPLFLAAPELHGSELVEVGHARLHPGPADLLVAAGRLPVQLLLREPLPEAELLQVPAGELCAEEEPAVGPPIGQQVMLLPLVRLGCAVRDPGAEQVSLFVHHGEDTVLQSPVGQLGAVLRCYPKGLLPCPAHGLVLVTQALEEAGHGCWPATENPMTVVSLALSPSDFTRLHTQVAGRRSQSWL